jgi:hypothetical protein
MVAAALFGAITWRRTNDRASATVVPPAALPAADAAQYASLAPPLRDAVAEARSLVALGERKSRNLLEIRAAQGRTSDLLDEIDELLRARPIAERFVGAVQAYRRGAAAVRQAMKDAQTGFVRLDWDRVARATAVMGQGASELGRASDLLDAAAGTASATPSPEAANGGPNGVVPAVVERAAGPSHLASDVL